MSVINDMLRDLDKRQAPERAAIAAIDVGRLIEPKKQLNTKALILVVLVLVVALAVLLKSRLVDTDQPLAAQNSVVPVPEVAIPQTEPEQAGIDPVQEAPAVIQLTVAVPDAVEVVQDELARDETAPDEKVQAAVNEAVEVASEVNDPKNDATEVGTEVATEVVTQKVVHEKATEAEPEAAANVNEAALESKQQVTLVLAKRPVISPEYLDQQNAEAALDLFRDGQASLAYRQLYEFIAGHTYAQKSRALLAGSLMQENRLAEAGDVLVRASLDQDPDMRQLKARWFAVSGDGAMAIYTLASNLPTLVDYPEYYALLASYYQQFGYPAKAAETYSSLVQHDAKVANWWAGLGLALDSTRQFTGAVAAYRQALQLPGLSPQFGEFLTKRLTIISQ